MATGMLDKGVTEDLLEEILEHQQDEGIVGMAKYKCLDNVSSAEVFCPFYRGTEHQQVIRCEGPYDHTVVRLGFAGKRKCKQFMERFCNTKICETCRIYRCINAKYDEELNE